MDKQAGLPPGLTHRPAPGAIPPPLRNRAGPPSWAPAYGYRGTRPPNRGGSADTVTAPLPIVTGPPVRVDRDGSPIPSPANEGEGVGSAVRSLLDRLRGRG